MQLKFESFCSYLDRIKHGLGPCTINSFIFTQNFWGSPSMSICFQSVSSSEINWVPSIGSGETIMSLHTACSFPQSFLTWGKLQLLFLMFTMKQSRSLAFLNNIYVSRHRTEKNMEIQRSIYGILCTRWTHMPYFLCAMHKMSVPMAHVCRSGMNTAKLYFSCIISIDIHK